MPTTNKRPKCFAEVGGQRILDWIMEAFAANDIQRICYVGGYQIEMIRRDYQQFTFYNNKNWRENNILASLMCAEAEMDEPFICCYSDILFKPAIVRALAASQSDITLAVDTQWRERYSRRSEHPTEDAEKVAVANSRVVRIGRDIDEETAYGEYIGVAHFSKNGATLLRRHYHRCLNAFWGRPFRGAPTFRKAYLIHLLQEMLEAGVEIDHVDTTGGYMEIDTQQDFQLALQFWR